MMQLHTAESSISNPQSPTLHFTQHSHMMCYLHTLHAYAHPHNESI